MTYQTLKQNLLDKNDALNQLAAFDINDQFQIDVYPASINKINDNIICIAKLDGEKFLFLFTAKNNESKLGGLKDLECTSEKNANDIIIRQCELSTKNRKVLQKELDYLNPSVIGLKDSFGFGDRIGLANPAHIRSLEGYNFLPVLAQQSIRELNRTNRTPDDVMDAAVWAVLQEGYKDKWGSDADHLKSEEDIDLMAKNGYTMFTFDPSDHVDNAADDYDKNTLTEKVNNLNWNDLNDNYEDSVKRYVDNKIELENNIQIETNERKLKQAYAKYGNAVIHIKKLFEYLKNNYGNQPFEVEVSVDETESVTTPFEHFFFASELNRLGIEFVSLAPRFIGDFEKGIDYKGDLDVFKAEYEKHVAIINHFGNYKISLHSGSDKFSAYRVIGGIKNAVTHVKTAGTSYLEALKVIAMKEPNFFRSILDYSTSIYNDEKKTYHVSADVSNVKKASDYSDAELADLFNSNDVRQILHVAFGKVLTDKDNNGNYIYKDDIIECLVENESTHYDLLIKHFKRHLDPFTRG